MKMRDNIWFAHDGFSPADCHRGIGANLVLESCVRRGVYEVGGDQVKTDTCTRSASIRASNTIWVAIRWLTPNGTHFVNFEPQCSSMRAAKRGKAKRVMDVHIKHGNVVNFTILFYGILR